MKFESNDTNSLRSEIEFFLLTKRNLKMFNKNLVEFIQKCEKSLLSLCLTFSSSFLWGEKKLFQISMNWGHEIQISLL